MSVSKGGFVGGGICSDITGLNALVKLVFLEKHQKLGVFSARWNDTFTFPKIFYQVQWRLENLRFCFLDITRNEKNVFSNMYSINQKVEKSQKKKSQV